MSKTKSKTKALDSRPVKAASYTRLAHATGPTYKHKGAKDAPLDSECPVIESAGDSSNASPTTPWAWATLADPSPSKLPPTVTPDGRYFFSVAGSVVKIHSITTGEVVSTLSVLPLIHGPEDVSSSAAPGHSQAITGVVINPENAFQLITSSLDGTLKVWDYMDGALLQTIDLAQPIFCLCAHAASSRYVFVAAGRSSSSKRSSKSEASAQDDAAILRVSLKPTDSTIESPRQKSSEVTPIGKVKTPAGLGISSSGQWLVAIGGHRVYVVKIAALKSGLTKFVSPEKLVTIAFHPKEDYFTTGDAKGVIRSWYCLKDELMGAVDAEKRAQTTTLHWHAHAVSGLAFTPNGAYLLSAGEEAVLVIWQLHSGKKEYVPRVGAPITGVAVCNASEREEEYLMTLSDGSHAFVSAASLKISRSFARVKFDPTSPDSSSIDVPAPMSLHTASSSIILPSSHPSSLQAFVPLTSKVLLELEVAPSNRVSKREDTPIEPACVTKCATASDGQWMATVDAREGEESLHREISLKMWSWDDSTSSWTLNTRIDRPHGLHAITSLSFRPSRTGLLPTVVSTGADGAIKLWQLRIPKKARGTESDYWASYSTSTFRLKVPVDASWSSDGSILVVALESYVVLYDPATTAVLQILTSAECPKPRRAHFLGQSGRYLLVSGQQNAVLWDLVDQSIRWHQRFSASIDAVVPHACDDSFVVLLGSFAEVKADTSTVEVYQALSSTPQRTHSLPFRLRNVIWSASTSTAADSGAFTLTGITQAWAVVALGDTVSVRPEEGASARSIGALGATSSRTIFEDIFGQSAFIDVHAPAQASRSVVPSDETSGDYTGFFDARAYLMPPLESMFDALMDTFLKPRSVEQVKPEDAIEEAREDEDMEMEVDEKAETETFSDPRHRVVDDRELDQFVELFRRHAVEAPRIRAPEPVKAASAGPKVNSVNPSPSPKVNGIAATPVRVRATKGGIVEDSTPASTPTTGKKRKKSVV